MTKKRELLIIDDDEIFLIVITRMFEKLGAEFQIVNAKNGIDGLKLISDRLDDNEPIPDLVMLDLNMPLCDGWEFLDEVKHVANSISLNIFVVSSTVDQYEIGKVKSYPFVKKMYSKPLSAEVLTEIIAYLKS